MSSLPSKICIIIVATLSAALSFAKDQVEIHIGIYAPFSNEKAFIGRNILGAMEMASEEVKASKINYSFYTLDRDTQNPKAAVILQKFIDTHHINVLVTEGSASGHLVAPVVKKNNILHFCLSNAKGIADGKNNFIASSSNYEKASILDKEVKPEFVAQFRKNYRSHPVTEAGYAFDVFHILNKSAVLAMKSKPDFSSEKISDQVKVLASGMGMMGPFSLDERGVLYTNTAVKTAKRNEVKKSSTLG